MLKPSLFHSRMICPPRQGWHLLETNLYHSRRVRPVVGGGGWGLAGKREFSKGRPSAFREVACRIPPHCTIGRTPPGSAGVPPASSPLGCRSVSLRWRTRPPCRREPHGPGRSRALAPLPVDPGGGDGRGFASVVRAGRPRSRGGLHPITSSHPRRSIGIRVYSCSFVVRLQKRSAVSSSNDLPTRAGASLI